MTSMIVLAMHGAPPRDLPDREVGELMRLHMQLEKMAPDETGRSGVEARYRELDDRIRTWPRTEANDPFHAGSLRLAEALERTSGRPVLVGFNEFCAPDVGQALDQAVGRGAQRIVVITPMMTPGGDHAEIELSEHVAAARRRHPEVAFTYAWPYDLEAVAEFLTQQVRRFEGQRAA